MFSKQYRQRSNNALKKSEKKHFTELISLKLSIDATAIITNKSKMSTMKLSTYNDNNITVYIIDNEPMFFECNDRFYPTVCALWRSPGLVPTITIVGGILNKLQDGVPLYVPGVITSTQLPVFSIGDVVAVNTEDNSAAVLVGRALMSSGDILVKSSGICVETLQIVGDHLCKDTKFTKIERPAPASTSGLPPATQHTHTAPHIKTPIDQWPSLGSKPTNHKEEWPTLGSKVTNLNSPSVEQTTPTNDEELSSVLDEIVLCDNVVPEDMDELLRFCLLTYIKIEGKKIVLPLKTNLLYRNHMTSMCPPDKELNFRRSTYKKMSKFMEAMQNEGFIQVREIERGVDAITSIDYSHPALRQHTVSDDLLKFIQEAAPSAGESLYVPPQIKEMFSITASVLQLFAPRKKGETMSTSEVRSILTDYIKTNKLNDAECKNKIKLTPELSNIINRSGACTWEQLITGVIGKMTHCTELHFNDGSVKTLKAKMDPIRMQVATRSGNKKVTLVSNLEAYGLNLIALSKDCRSSMSVSSGVCRTPGAKCDQLMVQGDQTHHLTKMLIEKYGLPKKYIEGADRMLAKKK